MATDPGTPEQPEHSSSDGAADRAAQRATGVRLDQLEARVIALEKRMGIGGVLGGAPATGVPVTGSGTGEAVRPETAPPATREEKVAIVRRMIDDEKAKGVAPATASIDPAVRRAPAVPAATAVSAPKARPPKPAKPDRPALTVEQFIGGKSFLVLGALIVVIGVGFFLKLAVDQGWIGKIPPLWRCLAAGGFGVGLLAVGELAGKRLGRFAAAGFGAAGLGVMYATSYAAYGMFELVDARGAFVLLLLVCGLGVGIALRGRSVALAVLSLLGGYVAPLIAASDDPPVWALAAHLLALLVVGSAIALRVPRQRVLATLTWWGTFALGSFWIVMAADTDPGLVIGFVGVVWATVHWTRVRLPESERAHVIWASMPGVSSFSTTVWAVGSLVLASDSIEWMMRSYATGIGFVVTLAVALVLGRGLRGLLGRPEGQRLVIGSSLLAQAGALLPLTLLLGIEPRWGELLVFFLLGTGAFWAGRQARAWSLVGYGGVLLLVGTGQVLLLPVVGDPTYSEGVRLGGLFASPWMGLIGLGALSWLACGWMSAGWMVDAEREGVVFRGLRGVCLVIGCVLLPIMFMHHEASREGLLTGWFGLTLVVFGAGWIVRHPLALAPAAVYLALSTLQWFVAFLVPGWMDDRGSVPVFMHPGLIWSVVLAVSWWIGAWVMRRAANEDVRDAGMVAWWVGGTLLLITTTLEVARFAGIATDDPTAQAGSVSIWWAVVAVGLLIGGFARAIAPLRYAGIGLLLVATGKVLTYDLAELSPAVRVGSFIGLGMVLLCVAAWYLRVGTKNAQNADENGPDENASPGDAPGV